MQCLISLKLFKFSLLIFICIFELIFIYEEKTKYAALFFTTLFQK